MTQDSGWKWSPLRKEYELKIGRVELSAGRDFVKGDFYIAYENTTNSYLEIARLRSEGVIVVGEVGITRSGLREILEPTPEDLQCLIKYKERFRNLPTKKARNLARLILESIEKNREVRDLK